MKLKEVWNSYIHYTRDVTEFSRKLGFGGAALCWIFKTADNKFPFLITLALIFVVSYFILDVLQSFIAALLYRWWLHKKESSHWNSEATIEVDINKPRWIDYPAFTLFICKSLALLAGFILIGVHLIK